MRIIIVQSEIEEAIKAYVLNQIAVREGQEVTIDFKATRGDDGMTAEVNIGSVAGNEQKSPEKATSSVQTTAATTTPPKASTASPAPAVAATKAISSEPAASAPVASTTTAPTEQASTDVGTKEEEAEVYDPPAFLKRDTKAETVEEPAAKEVPVSKPSFLNTQPAAAPADSPVPASGKSLFANLTKPVNPKPAEA